MKILGIETATETCSVCFAEGEEKILGEISYTAGMLHSSKLLPAIAFLTKEMNISTQEINAIAISIGPGSFTGLRVGMAAAKGLAFALDVPIVGIPTLEALAYQCVPTELTICPVLDAKKKEIYTALYKWNKKKGLVKTLDERAISFNELAALTQENVILIGDALIAYADKIDFPKNFTSVPLARCYPRASSVAVLGLARLKKGKQDNLDKLKPFYVRMPDAETVKAKKKVLN